MAKAIGRGGIDSPDFIQSTTPHENPVEITLAELAIRMGFPHVFERTGNVLYYETFEYGLLSWNARGSEAGNTPKISTQGLLHSPYSCALITEEGATGWSYINNKIAYPYLTTYGLEVAIHTTEEFYYLDISLYLYTGTYLYAIILRLDDSTHDIWIRTLTEDWVVVGNYDMGTWDIEAWHPIKIVGDMIKEDYARLMIDGEDWSLTQYDLYKVADTTRPHIDIRIDSYREAAFASTILVDNVIVTINEPT